ncbi:hypothetical protein ACI65C_012879 [Semiaphis heraclei]
MRRSGGQPREVPSRDFICLSATDGRGARGVVRVLGLFLSLGPGISISRMTVSTELSGSDMTNAGDRPNPVALGHYYHEHKPKYLYPDGGSDPGACDGNSHWAELSGPSTDTPHECGGFGTSVDDTVPPVPSSQKRPARQRRRGEFRGNKRFLENKTNAEDNLTSGTQSKGGLVISETESVGTSSIEAALTRGTTSTDGSTADSDSDSLVRPVDILPSKPIKEPATDNRGVYLLGRYPFRVIANGDHPKATIVVVNPAVGVLALSQLGTSHFAAGVLTVGTFRLTLISAYFQFSEPMRSYTNALESILDRVNGGVLICADVNARSAVIRGSACLDVTLASNSVRVVDWSAVHDFTSSDHAVISFEILALDARPKDGAPKSVRYNWSRTNWIKFRKTLIRDANSRAGELECPGADTCTKALSEVLTQACEAQMRRPAAGKHRSLGRWKVRLRNAKNALRRRAIRAVFVRRKAEHKRYCFKARRDSWRNFVTETGNRDPWGPVYKWLKSGGSRPSERQTASIRTADGSYTSTLLDTGCWDDGSHLRDRMVWFTGGRDHLDKEGNELVYLQFGKIRVDTTGPLK